MATAFGGTNQRARQELNRRADAPTRRVIPKVILPAGMARTISKWSSGTKIAFSPSLGTMQSEALLFPIGLESLWVKEATPSKLR